jgi:asparagine synthase (glutamine-hydrolysing)
MCGICGIASKVSRTDDLDRAVLAMVDRLSHRGPDGRGVLTLRPPAVKRPVTLGHTRLAIIDLSDAGRQPMSSDDGRVHLILNGEVYNHRRLRDGLTKRGYRFRSTCDTEVVLRLYEERGPASVAELEGMFALAVLDTSRQILLLARDPMGIKPLYYHEGEQGLVFGSEIKAILASGLYRTEVEWQGIWDYFTYLYIPCPHTAYRGVRQLPPAHLLEHDLATGATTLSRYWCVRSRPEIARLSFADAKAMLREQLTTVVRDQLVADVPVGVFLSSGADSTVVAGLATAESHDIHSYTVVFDDPALSAYDERAGARAVSRHLGTKHTELPVAHIDPFDLLDMLPLFDQPFGNPTAHLNYLLSSRAREHITVALCGAGGDELFAGYPRYRAEQLARPLGRVPASLLRTVGRGLSAIPDSHHNMRLRRLKEFFLCWDGDPVERFTNWTYYMDEATKASLVARPPAVRSSQVLRELFERSSFPDHGTRMLDVDVQSFLLDNILEYTDKTSMAVALEARVPLLDHHFVEAALNIPYRYKLRGLSTKAIFRAAFSDLFPPESRRLPKRGFNVPLALWINKLDEYFEVPADVGHPLRRRLGDSVGITWRTGVLSWDVIQRLREEHRRGLANNAYELFGIIMFDRWWSTYIENGQAGSVCSANTAANGQIVGRHH